MALPDPETWVASLKTLGDKPGQQRCTEALTPASGPVCVTGATGFIALHLVEQLLQKGYTVVATVRSAKDSAKMAPLLELQRAHGEDKLRVAEGVDCLRAETFDAAVAGCVGVFHTASPFHFNTADPLNDLVQPARQGTVGCLQACEKAGTVRRVVVTSSFAAIFNAGTLPWDYTYTSKDWNISSQPDKDGKFPEPLAVQGYRYSKTVAEKSAWDFAQKEGCAFDVATINPPMVIGHNHNRPKSVEDLNTSSATVLKILLGKQAPNPNSIGWVDVADVARAHIFAYEHPEAGGRRFLCSADEVPLWTEVAQWLKEIRPDSQVVTTEPASGAGLRMGLDCSELKTLGFSFTPLKASLKAQVDSLAAQGFLSQ